MAKQYIVESSMIGLPGGGAEFRRRGEVVTSEELGDREARYVELGAIREMATGPAEATPEQAPEPDLDPAKVTEPEPAPVAGSLGPEVAVIEPPAPFPFTSEGEPAGGEAESPAPTSGKAKSGGSKSGGR